MGSSFMRTESLLWRVYARVYPTVTRSYPYRDMMDAVAGKIPAGSKLVDLGCGTGGLLRHIAAPVSYFGMYRQAGGLPGGCRHGHEQCDHYRSGPAESGVWHG